jgi:hypothetical protein
LDHVVPFPDGPTSAKNLVDSCVHEHHLKHSPGWQVKAHPDGRLEWITPTKHRYFSDPHDYRPNDPPLPSPPPPPPAPPTAPKPASVTWDARRYCDGFSHYFDDPEPEHPDPPPF